MRMDTWRVLTTGTRAIRAASPPTQPSTELWVWTRPTPSLRTSRARRATALKSQAPRIGTSTTSIPSCRARSVKAAPGWPARSTRHPRSAIQQASVRVRTSWPPRPGDDSVWRTVLMPPAPLRARRGRRPRRRTARSTACTGDRWGSARESTARRAPDPRRRARATTRAREARIRGAEERHGGRAHGRGQMGHAGVGAHEAVQPAEDARQQIGAVPTDKRGDVLPCRRDDRGRARLLALRAEQNRERAGPTESRGELGIGGGRPELRGAEGGAQMEPDRAVPGSEANALEEDVDLFLGHGMGREREGRRIRSRDDASRLEELLVLVDLMAARRGNGQRVSQEPAATVGII